MKKKSHWIFDIFKISLGLALLVLSLWGINWNLLLSTLESVQSAWLIAAIASIFVSLGLKVVRWHMLLRNYGIKVSLIQTCGAYFLGQASNIILPVRGGEVVRFGWLRSQQQHGAAEIVTTIGIEKVLDLVFFLALSFLITAYIPIQEIRQNTISFAIGGFFLTIALLAVIWLMPGVWQANRGKIENRVPVRFHSILVGIDRWMSESKLVRQPKYLFPVVGVTLSIWIVMLTTNLILLRSFGLPAQIVAGGLVLVTVYLGVLPALMPGNIGPFYFFTNLALTPFGINPQVRIAYAILLHATVTIPPLILGGCFVLFSRRQFTYPDYQKIS
ncbi:MAG TPA: lysylphosphatidylglycerol synthase transmembrane domain-containing protein [Anaerolineaceae bacterium]|nr:lysylphosphatidylglycerol synthase transmembrane domain-containing protein [Anaerolineaceae bacterium]